MDCEPVNPHGVESRCWKREKVEIHACCVILTRNMDPPYVVIITGPDLKSGQKGTLLRYHFGSLYRRLYLS